MEKEMFEVLVAEFNEVNDRVTKLRDFILDEEKIKEVDNLNRDLMIGQLKAMEAYLSILSVRIGLNTPRTQPAVQQEADPESPADNA